MNGVLNILKPPSMSSGQVVGAVRRLFGLKKVGHTGTLDPGAAGVLPICLGRATKLADYIMRGEKEYIAEATIGLATDTLDSYGKVIATSEVRANREDMERIMQKFTGKILQVPPMYSAIKHNGQPLYKLARAGTEIKKPPREVEIYKIDLLSFGQSKFLFKIKCSKGTYIRSLLADMAAELGCLAYTSFLLRSKTCNFELSNSYTLEELQDEAARERALISIEDAIAFMPELRLADYLFPIVNTGGAIELEKAKIVLPKAECFRVYCKEEFIGVGIKEENYLKIQAKLNY